MNRKVLPAKTETHNGAKTFAPKRAKPGGTGCKKNGETEKSVWLIIYKKGSGVPSVYYSEAVDKALCFGWIDSKPNKCDDESYY